MNKTVLIISNESQWTYNLRLEIIQAILNEKCTVYLAVGSGNRIDELKQMGCKHVDIPVDRHGMNPLKDLKLIKQYKKLIKSIKPDIVFSYTIKPNIYGAIAAKKYHVPFVANITGLGTAVENGGIKQKICVFLYKIAFKKVKKVFFQNTANQQFFIDHKIALGKHDLLPGSGVNLERFKPLPYPDQSIIRFVYIGRIMKEKGVDYYLEAARYIKDKYPNTEFHVCGFTEKEYQGKLQEYIDQGLIIYHGMVKDVREIHKITHCLVFPSYYPEGISNVLLEAAACARPIITTDRAGCRETVDNGKTGYVIPIKNQEALNSAILKFLELNEKDKMGLEGRKKIEQEFDRRIVVNKYLEELKKICE